MLKLKNLKGAEQLKAEIEAEERKGNPRFKNKIVSALSERFNVPVPLASDIVFSRYIQEKIDDDMDWSQHMGVDFWAKEIYRHMDKIKTNM